MSDEWFILLAIYSLTNPWHGTFFRVVYFKLINYSYSIGYPRAK